jgi:uncharacterized membrane protein required for colicin V production
VQVWGEMTAQEISINEWVFVAAVALVFGYVGWRRGLTTSLYMLIGLVIGVVFADRLAKAFEPWVNFAWKVILAMARDRAFSPEELLKATAKQPELITQAIHRMYMGTVMFVLLGVLGFLIGRKRSVKARAPRPTTRILAALVGAVNGYLVTFFMFPRYITASRTVITMSNVNIRLLLQVQLTLPILIMVLVLITVGVLGTREGKSKGK